MSTEPAIQTTGHRATLHRCIADIVNDTKGLWRSPALRHARIRAIYKTAVWTWRLYRQEAAEQRAFERRFPLNPARVARRERLTTSLIFAVGLVAIAAVLVDILYLGSLPQ